MSNVDVVSTALAAVRTGDLRAAADVVADDFVWQIPGTSSISGEVKGAQAWSEKLRTLLEAGLQPELIEMLPGDRHVAAVQRNTASVNGSTLDVRVVNLFHVEDGKVTRLETFFGDQPAAEAFWNSVL